MSNESAFTGDCRGVRAAQWGPVDPCQVTTEVTTARLAPVPQQDQQVEDTDRYGRGPQFASSSRKSLIPPPPPSKSQLPGLPHCASNVRKSTMPTVPSPSSQSQGQGEHAGPGG